MKYSYAEAKSLFEAGNEKDFGAWIDVIMETGDEWTVEMGCSHREHQADVYFEGKYPMMASIYNTSNQSGYKFRHPEFPFYVVWNEEEDKSYFFDDENEARGYLDSLENSLEPTIGTLIEAFLHDVDEDVSVEVKSEFRGEFYSFDIYEGVDLVQEGVYKLDAESFNESASAISDLKSAIKEQYGFELIKWKKVRHNPGFHRYYEFTFEQEFGDETVQVEHEVWIRGLQGVPRNLNEWIGDLDFEAIQQELMDELG